MGNISRILAAGLCLLGMGAAMTASTTKTRTYAADNSAFSNAQIGYAPMIDTAEAGDAALRYLELTWREAEPEEGVYAWEAIREKYDFASLREQGIHLVLRFVCDVPGQETHLDIPDWLYAQTKDGSWYDTDYGKGYSPNYANAVFRAAHHRVLYALAEFLGTDGFVSYVELGSLGHWGEWHIKSEDGLVPMPDEAIRDEYAADYLAAFPTAKLLLDDATLDGVDVVIFDEFHERSINTDLALALTRQTQQVIRPDLKIVIMSATIATENICKQFDAPLIESEGRMFPVSIVNATEDTTPASAAVDTARAILSAHRNHEGDILAFLPGQGDIERCMDMLGAALAPTNVYPLYGNLSPEQQRKAIAPSRDGERKVVLATPIAETSITIEGVRVVIDTGLCRSLVVNGRTGLSRLETVRISMDMATQRSGRAGRVAPGTCYRLWTLASEHNMAPQRKPEIETQDLAPLALSVAAFGESNIETLPWLDVPTIKRGESCKPAHIAWCS